MNNCLLENEININSVVIRKAEITDVLQIVSLLEECFSIKIPLSEICLVKSEIVNGTSSVATFNGDVIGYVNGSGLDKDELYFISANQNDVYNSLLDHIYSLNKCVSDYLEIRNLVVSEKARGLHIGNLLVNDIMKRSTLNNYLVVGLKQTKLNKWLAEKIFLNLNYKKLIDKENYWYEQSKQDSFNCNLCLKDNDDEICCRCDGSVWLLDS